MLDLIVMLGLQALALGGLEQQITDAQYAEGASRKPRVKPVRIKDLIDHTDVSDAEVMEMIINMPVSILLRVVYAKMPSIAKLL